MAERKGGLGRGLAALIPTGPAALDLSLRQGDGIARALLARLEHDARQHGYRQLVLETGARQQPAIALYSDCGWRRIAPYGAYVGDPTSVCFGKALTARR